MDIVASRYAVQLNEVNSIALTKLDILGGLKTIRVARSYRHDGKTLEDFPAEAEVLVDCEPAYDELPGWEGDISEARRFKDLPKEARNYVTYLERVLEVPISIISVGAERSQTIRR